MSKTKGYKPASKVYADLSKIKIELLGRKTTIIDMVTYPAINIDKIHRELAEHGARYAWIGSLYEHTHVELMVLDAEIAEDAYGEAMQRGKKHPTRWLLDSLCKQNPEYCRLTLQKGKLKRLLDAMKHRGEILQNQSSVMKTEKYQLRE